MAGQIYVVLLAIVVSANAFLIPSDIEERNRRVLNDINSNGYPAEYHTTTTQDGYELALHRIPHGRNGSPGKRPVVFVMHGLMSTSTHFLLVGPEYSLGYNLAEAGYDVWMGNQRGNFYSRRHVSLNPDDEEDRLKFFDYSWEEIGMYDIPAMVDYALAHTGEDKLHYIGHSQGGTIFLVQASMDPGFSNKFASAHLLAGVGYMEHFPFELLKRVSSMTTLIYNLGRSMGLVELSFDAIRNRLPFAEQVKLDQEGITDYCAGDPEYRAYCELIGLNYLNVDTSNRDVLGTPDFGGASLKQIAHFGQNVKDQAFRRWDFGLLTNRVVYGSFTPPAYDLSRITVDVTMHYSLNDILLAEADVLAMAAVMPNTYARKIANEAFTHTDYIFSNEQKEMVTDYIIEKLDQFSS